MPARNSNALFLTAGLVAGCSALFGIDDPERRESPVAQGGSGGAAGSAEPSGGGGASGAGQAGDGGSVVTGGAAGNATGGVGDIGGSGGAAGLSGAGGEGGTEGDEFPTVDTGCSTPGALACVEPAGNGRLICKDGTWTVAESCSDSGTLRNCDRRTGACARVETDCQNNSAYARCNSEHISLSCGPDLVTLVPERCPLGCDGLTGTCIEPSGDTLVVDRTPDTDQDFQYWPSPVIPVCLDDPGLPDWAPIRDEVESTWGRYASITFPGWGDCSDPAPESGEVRIFLDDLCRDELGGVSEYGYPGPSGRVDMKICQNYVDAENVEQKANDAMRRFVARHLFGHVLGLKHDSAYFMTQGVRASEVDAWPFDMVTIRDLQLRHGPKPRGSLVNASGRCIAVQGGELVTSACDGSPATHWLPLGGQLLAANGECLRESGGSPATLEVCAPGPEFVWETKAVRWNAFGNQCVQATSTLTADACREFGDPDQTWSFEFLANGRVRIHYSNSGDCVQAPSGASRVSPGRAPCGTGRDELATTRDGQLAFAGYCMVVRYIETQYEVFFEPCLAHATQVFSLSGAFEHGSGTSLTLAGDTLEASALSGAPTPSQIFDYHF